MREKKSVKFFLKRLDFILLSWLTRWCYPQYYRPKYNYVPHYRLLFEFILPQKILRINGDVPWPVHYTSKVRAAHKIKKGILCDPGDNINVYIQAMNGIIMGNNVGISPGCAIISADHNHEDHLQHDDCPPIIIGNDVFIYANSIILPGVQIGNNVIIGAGSVVTKNIPSNSIAVGNPCKVIKSKSNYNNKLSIKDFNRKIPKKYLNYFS